MTNQEEWDALLENLFGNALKAYQDTRECRYLQEKREQLDARLAGKDTVHDPDFLDQFLFEAGLDAERKSEFVYRQGMRDGVWLLKTLGVLA